MQRRFPRLCLSLLVGLPLAASLPGGSMIQAILGISFLIFVHEWGHFYACRLTGTRTETFSIGFGPRLFGWEKTRDGQRRFTVGRRQTDPADHAMDFRVAAIPLGGYVKMAGELPGEGGDDSRPPAPDEFPGKSAWARIFIVCAGVIMNFITAIVFYTACIEFGGVYEPPLVGTVEPGSAAWSAGVQTGDRIISIGGNDTPTFLDVRVEVAVGSSDTDGEIIVERAGKRETLAYRPIYNEERGLLVFGVGAVAGVEFGKDDTTVAIGHEEPVTVAGIPVRGGTEALKTFMAALNVGISPVEIRRADGTTVRITPSPVEDAEAPGPKIGIVPWVEATVTAVRGAAEGVLKEGDVLVSANAGGVVRDLRSRLAVQALPFNAPVSALVVRRGEHTEEITLDLPDRASAAKYFQSIALTYGKLTNRAIAIEAGGFHLTESGLWRYPSSPAMDAGFPPGARVVRVGTVAIGSFEAIPDALRSVKAGEPITFTVTVGDGPEQVLDLTPVALVHEGDIEVRPVIFKEPWKTDGFGHAVQLGWDRMVRETTNVFRTIGALVTGNLSFNKNIAGPVRLIGASKSFAEDGFLRLLWFLAYVSVMLAVLNILPIPILDGGQLVFILIEKIRGKKLSEALTYNLMKVGFFLLLILMFFAFKNDIMWAFDL